jgi:hypothetical protein
MADRILFPNTIDHIRLINSSLVDNALAGRTSFIIMPSTYQYAYMLTHETGELPMTEGFVAPDESATQGRENTVNIITAL